MDIKSLLEKMQQFAGEPEQKAGDQVRGTDVAKKSGKGKKHPFLHQLVGDSKKNEYKNKLIKEFQEFKEAKEEYVLYIDGKPASKYTDHNSASRDIEFIRAKFPNKTIELKQEVCNLKTLPEGKLPDEYELKQPAEQTTQDVLYSTAVQAMINASREGVQLDIEDAMRQASAVTKIPYVPSQLPGLYAQLEKIEKQLATEKPVSKNKANREHEKLTHQTSPEEERRNAEWFKRYGSNLTKNMRLRTEDNDQFVGQWAQAIVDGWSGEVVRTDGENLVVSDGREIRVYHPTELTPKQMNEDGAPNTVSLDVPLMIRLFEYAREDAKTDMDLHFVAEKMIELSQKGRTLSMDDYNEIVGQTTEAIDPPSSQGTTTDPAKPGQLAQKTPDELNKERQEQQNLTKSLSQLKSAGIDINPTQAQKAFTKADTGVALNPTDKETVSKLAPAVGDIIANPTLAGQFKSLVQKAQQQAALEKK
jgi:hypothetical protein